MASFLRSSPLSRVGLSNGLPRCCRLSPFKQGASVTQRARADGLVASRRLFSQQQPKRPRFSSRLRTALRNTKIQWYQIPVGVGIGFIGLMHFYKVTKREREKQEQEEGAETTTRPKRRPRIRPDGPW